jgi:hypothetical protein
MNCIVVDHRSATKVIPTAILEDAKSMVESVNIEIGKSASPKIKQAFLQELLDRGWSDEVRIDDASAMTITSQKGDIGMCVQIGNVARVYADLLKLQTLFVNERITAGILIVPTRSAASRLGQNHASLERLTRELDIFSQTITAPIASIGFED